MRTIKNHHSTGESVSPSVLAADGGTAARYSPIELIYILMSVVGRNTKKIITAALVVGWVFLIGSTASAFTQTPNESLVESPVTFTATTGDLAACFNWYVYFGTDDAFRIQATSTQTFELECGVTEAMVDAAPAGAITCPFTMEGGYGCTTDEVGEYPTSYTSYYAVIPEFTMTSTTIETTSTIDLTGLYETAQWQLFGLAMLVFLTFGVTGFFASCRIPQS